MMAAADDEFRELLDLLCDGQLDTAQEERLAELLEDSPERQREYLQYIDLHARMQAEQTAALPLIKSVTLKQMTVEFDDRGLPIILEPGQRKLTGSTKSVRKGLLVLVIILILAVPILSWFAAGPPTEEGKVIAVVQSVKPQSMFSFWKKGAELRIGKHQIPEGEIELELINGSLVTIKGGGTIEFASADVLAIQQGEIQFRSSMTGANLDLGYAELNLNSNGADFDIVPTSDPEIIQLKVLTGNVTVSPCRYEPRHLWNFDDIDQRVRDSHGSANGMLAPGTKRVAGLVGGGGSAIEFDNTSDAAIAVGSGGGEALGTGTFAVNDGITLEAFMKPNWTAKGYSTGHPPDYDEIIRKEGDGELRFLLSFQNDDPRLNNYSFPKQQPGPVLAFGLYLIGKGYQELEVPLEGKNAPITLAELKDGETHHVAAIYRTSTGLKEIYIDGKRVAFHQYPPGTRPLTGGPGEVVIGNIKPPGEAADEPFNGILDDVAFYDFALTNLEVERHAAGRAIEVDYAYFRYRDTYDYTVNTPTLIDRTTGLPLKTLNSASPPGTSE